MGGYWWWFLSRVRVKLLLGMVRMMVTGSILDESDTLGSSISESLSLLFFLGK